MGVLTGRFWVDRPNAPVSRSQFFAVSTGPLDLPRPARSGGLQYQIGYCNLPTCYEVECLAGHNTKVLDNTVTTVTGDPFVVYSDILCTPVGLTDDMLRTYLHEQLIAGEQSTVEDAFSRQLCGQAPGLANNAAVVSLTSSLNPVAAVSKLEASLYSAYGLAGVIHAPYTMGAYFAWAHLIEKDSKGIWRTNLGTAVNFGNYAGLSPAGAAPAAGSTWLYITGQPTVYRTSDSDLFVTSRRDVLNRSTNQLTGVMEREYVVTFDCRVAATETVLTGAVV